MNTLSRSRSLLAVDSRNTPLTVHDGARRRQACTAHGYRPLDKALGRTGFNGEFQERSGVYLLGSYRAYNPVLRCLHNPDSLSPFGRGGLNAYAYCLGDPVNHVDPTGHLPWWVSLGAGLGATLLTAGFAGPALAAAGVTVSATVAGKVAAVATTVSIASAVGGGLAKQEALKAALSWTGLVAGVVGGAATGLALNKIIPRTVFRRGSTSRNVQRTVPTERIVTSESTVNARIALRRAQRMVDERRLGLIEDPENVMDFGKNKEVWLGELTDPTTNLPFEYVARQVAEAQALFRAALVSAHSGLTPFGDVSQVVQVLRLTSVVGRV